MEFSVYAIAQNLYRRRREKKITQADLAEAAELSANAISKWESGLMFPNCESLCKLCEALGCTPDEILQRQTKEDEE